MTPLMWFNEYMFCLFHKYNRTISQDELSILLQQCCYNRVKFMQCVRSILGPPMTLEVDIEAI